MKEPSEVYDNPNYTHMIIGGQPFFILPNGELSKHVPVPAVSELLTPAKSKPTLISEGGSSPYRSTSDYDTDSSTYRPESDKASNGCPPIYEEIDKFSNLETLQIRGDQEGNEFVESNINIPGGNGRGQFIQSWMKPNTFGHMGSSRTNLPHNQPTKNISVYYYSDTLKRKSGGNDTERESVLEYDSGMSSRGSGFIVNSENILHQNDLKPFRLSNRGHRLTGNDRTSQQSFSKINPEKLTSTTVNTNVIVTNIGGSEPVVNL